MEKSQAKLIITRIPDQFGDVEQKAFEQSPPKSNCSSAKNLVGYGTVKGFAVFRDLKTLEFVVLPMDIESTVESVSNELLSKQIESSCLSTSDAKKAMITMGIGDYKFPELKKSGYYVLERGTHTWSKKKPVPVVEKTEKEVVEEKNHNTEEASFM